MTASESTGSMTVTKLAVQERKFLPSGELLTTFTQPLGCTVRSATFCNSALDDMSQGIRLSRPFPFENKFVFP